LHSRYLENIERNPNMDIWYLDSREGNSIHVYSRRDSNIIQVIRDGVYNPVLGSGSCCSLVDEKYEPIFNQVSNDQVTIRRVIVRDYQFKTEVNNYIELKIVNTVDYKTIQSVDSSGLKVWHYNGSIFVSGELKAELLKVGEQELEFSKGFSLFG
jgi:hypothetical protein